MPVVIFSIHATATLHPSALKHFVTSYALFSPWTISISIANITYRHMVRPWGQGWLLHTPTFFSPNRPLALRGHVTSASFKQWVGILLMPKFDRAHKNYLTPENWGETYLREIFYGTLIFQQSSIICIGRHVGGHTLALQHGGQNFFFLRSCQTFDSYAQMCCKRSHINFSTFSLKFKSKICVQKELIHNFKNHILVTWPTTNLLILRKWCRFEKQNRYYFVQDMTL